MISLCTFVLSSSSLVIFLLTHSDITTLASFLFLEHTKHICTRAFALSILSAWFAFDPNIFMTAFLRTLSRHYLFNGVFLCTTYISELTLPPLSSIFSFLLCSYLSFHGTGYIYFVLFPLSLYFIFKDSFTNYKILG